MSVGTIIMGAAIIIAASNSSPESKARADIVCDGKNDTRILRRSLEKAGRVKMPHDITPAEQKEVECYGRHSVVWLPGDYYLKETLVIPDAMDVVIESEGAYFHYDKPEGDAIVIQGMNRCRYRFGTIDSKSTGAALAIRPTKEMPAIQSIVTFMGHIGHDQKGTGLQIDPVDENVCVNKIEGTDISGFQYGVRVMDPGGKVTDDRPTRKCDTNQYWFAYIRQCLVCIEEGQTGVGIDCGLWTVNVDATLPGAVAIRTAASGNRWTIIMGTWNPENTKAIVIGKNAMDNTFQMRPYIYRPNHPKKHPLGFPVEDNSGNTTNRIE